MKDSFLERRFLRNYRHVLTIQPSPRSREKEFFRERGKKPGSYFSLFTVSKFRRNWE
ncbi:hypothetical protein LEP1GSC061_0505 [Leptospira wolffii serovar Khorat str. Khorat-H2]|nr:hypothetical protein LEP1GSC061_0505 [Leptospira wolffii serovar Khorat str. Khorat-H2]